MKTVGLVSRRARLNDSQIVVGLCRSSRPVVLLCEGRLAKLYEELVESI
jgi:hypothetical protein